MAWRRTGNSQVDAKPSDRFLYNAQETEKRLRGQGDGNGDKSDRNSLQATDAV